MVDKIRVNFKAYDEKQLAEVIQKILIVARRSGAIVIGPIPLPSKKRRFCVNRSPHVDKKSRDQFELCTHKRLLYITNTTQLTMENLMKMDVSSGVKVDIKVG
ncbi:MAG: 30S ribosomal protein S10 [SAR324 cluster bacterium]|nr:30S ribosomal protein S10 [SAR324 cluster bacterium]